jgi:hypothetical protein
MVDDELQAPKAYNSAVGEANDGLMLAVTDDNKFQ